MAGRSEFTRGVDLGLQFWAVVPVTCTAYRPLYAYRILAAIQSKRAFARLHSDAHVAPAGLAGHRPPAHADHAPLGRRQLLESPVLVFRGRGFFSGS